jgi:hypothetical protein
MTEGHKVQSTSQKTNYRFNREDIKVNDVFLGEHYDLNGKKFAHYFYCIYSQSEDEENKLFRDIIGLLITTKEIPGYNYKMKINDRDAYVCIDNEVRFVSDKEVVQNKYISVQDRDKKNIINMYKKFYKKKIKMMKGKKKW